MGNSVSSATWTQSAFIPKPTLTEQNLPSQRGKVHIVTGGYAGIGEQLTQILYSRGAKVYIAGRSSSKADAAIKRITKAIPSTSETGELIFLHLDLADLATIKASAEQFLSKETRLDVLVNNAGVMFPPKGTKTAQNHDLQFGTNCLGPHLFTKLLHPILQQTAESSPPNTVRVIWASSLGIQVLSPKGGVQFDDKTNQPKDFNQNVNYAQTKVGNNLLAIKTQELLKANGIVSTCFNPGNLMTELQRHTFGAFLLGWMLYPAKLGAYTELWSGWSDELTVERGVSYVMPWGRDGTEYVRKDIRAAIDDGLVDKFWGWCERETAGFA